eukprot:TRINITY_DN14492_c0_g1_i1.p1 TRINITY_DN14492_c0_g1~~TRINITY_DN14492_c0_g1_i1.p1  ORF type:complete len:547 (+),score=137.78 TRINITY_DN14492_c0_g1_i1:1547-3187(+)
MYYQVQSKYMTDVSAEESPLTEAVPRVPSQSPEKIDVGQDGVVKEEVVREREVGVVEQGKINFSVTTARRMVGEGLSYWVYQIVVQTRLGMYAGQPHFKSQRSDGYFEVDGVTEIQCEKRYSDIEWLHSALKSTQQGAPVPPIPHKDASGTVDKVLEYLHHDEKTQDNPLKQPLVAERMRGIEWFFRYLGSSPFYATCDVLRNFLLRGPSELAEYRAEFAAMASSRLYKVPTPSNITNISGWVKGLWNGTPPSRMPVAIQRKKGFCENLVKVLHDMSKECERAITAESGMRGATTAVLSKQHQVYPPQTEPLTKLSTQIGCRVVDADGHRGLVRWAGSLAKAPKPDMVYVGIEWDEVKTGANDGTIFGEQKFVCPQGRGSFVPPDVLFVEPTEKQDPLLAALMQTSRQIEISLSSEDRKSNELQEVKVTLRFFHGLVQSFISAISYMEGLHSTALTFEAQGAADGRNPELARTRDLITQAEDQFNKEWDHFRSFYIKSLKSILTAYLVTYDPAPHPFYASLSHWVTAIPDMETEGIGPDLCPATGS